MSAPENHPQAQEVSSAQAPSLINVKRYSDRWDEGSAMVAGPTSCTGSFFLYFFVYIFL